MCRGGIQSRGDYCSVQSFRLETSHSGGRQAWESLPDFSWGVGCIEGLAIMQSTASKV